MAVGDTINYNDAFAALRTSMNTILNGTGVHGGYNQAYSIAANPTSGALIDDAYYDSLYASAAKIADYYNITNPFTAVNAGDTIQWADYAGPATQFKTDIETRFNNPWNYSGVWDQTLVSGASQSVSNWNGTRLMTTRASFGSAAAMDAWFAAGGQLRVSMSHNDTTSNQQGTSWEQLTSEMGTYTFSVQATDSTTLDVSTRKKYSDLGGTLTYVKREYADDVDYSSNYADIAAYVSGGDLFIQVRLVDAHAARTGSGSGYDGPWSWTGADQAVGTSTVTIQQLNISTTSLSFTNPTLTVTDAL